MPFLRYQHGRLPAPYFARGFLAADMPFLRYLLERGLEEFPGCPALLMLQLVFLRFVFRDAQASSGGEGGREAADCNCQTMASD